MMAKSLEAERKREAAKAASKASRDSNAETTIRVWEDDIIPRWPDAIRERKTLARLRLPSREFMKSKSGLQMTIAALLLLNLPNITDAFIALANVLNRPLPLSFFTHDEGAKSSAYNLVLKTLKDRSRPLYDHINALSSAASTSQTPDGTTLPSGPDVFLNYIFTALFTSCLAIDEAARLWDIYVFEGDAVIVRAAVALMIRNEGDLFACKTLENVTEVLEGLKKPRKAVAEIGAEDTWIKLVREAGKI
ncbi:TBC1 domain family member 12 [Ceratocystis platani]|uniref:TBC1 domain family member 12 n=1 Tax=Ceratocystis fimbriata f. sp. platani TaxID=88771 RepID=A0A0F8DBN6_CERFI|nr:TBC1 domain family member 12 [Ceratocystis platani]